MRFSATKLGSLLFLSAISEIVFLYIYAFVYYRITVGSISGKNALATALHHLSSSSEAQQYMMSSIVFTASLSVIFLICLFGFKLNLLKTISFKNLEKQIDAAMKGLAVTLFLNFFFSLIIEKIMQIFKEEGTSIPGADFSVTELSPELVISMGIRMIITAPFIEEVIYRGLIIALIRPFSAKLAIFTSAFIFGLMHGNLQQFLPAFAGGIAIAYITVKFKSILPALLIHCANNLLVFLSEIFKQTPTVALILNLLIFMIIICGFFLLISYMIKRKVSISENPNCLLKKGTIIGAVYLNIAMLIYLSYEIYRYISSIMLANK